MADARPSLAVLSGWGVSPELLRPWLATLEASLDIHVVDIPDLDTPDLNPHDLESAQLLSVDQRSERLLQSAPANSYWLGWSLGGAIALDLASYSPQSVRGVITLATNPCFVAQDGWPGMEADTFANFLQAYGEMPAKTLQRFASLQVSGAVEPRTQLRELKAKLLNPQPLLAELLELLAIDRRQSLGGLEVPALMVLADSDALVPAELGEALSAQFPEVQLSRVAAASHLLFQDQAEQLREEVLNWISLQENGSDAR